MGHPRILSVKQCHIKKSVHSVCNSLNLIAGILRTMLVTAESSIGLSWAAARGEDGMEWFHKRSALASGALCCPRPW